MKTFSCKIPAGSYYIGDPCYALSDEDWDSFINLADFKDGVYIFKGDLVGWFRTRVGDGVFRSNIKHQFPVDSGTLGFVPARLVKQDIGKLGIIQKFEKDFVVSLNDSSISFGHIVIDIGEEDGWDD